MLTHKNTIEKAVEIDPEAADWTRRGAEMIAYEGRSATDVARLFNEHKVGGKQTWSDGRVRQHYGRERLVGKDVRHKSRQVTDRQTGKKKVVSLPKSEWIWRDVPHLRILSDELAEAVHRKLGLGAESFGRNRIIDEAVLRTIMATLFTDAFIADLTAEVNKRLAWIARQPIPSTKKLEQEIANEDRQLKRLTDRLARLDDTHLDAVLAKAEEMGRLLAAKREQLLPRARCCGLWFSAD